MVCEPFYCHKVGLSEGGLDQTNRRLCVGYADELSRRHEAGEYEVVDANPARQKAARRALAALISFEDGIKAGDDQASSAALAKLDADSMRELQAVFVPGLFG